MAKEMKENLEVTFKGACVRLSAAYGEFKKAFIEYIKTGNFSPVDGTFWTYGDTKAIYKRIVEKHDEYEDALKTVEELKKRMKEEGEQK